MEAGDGVEVGDRLFDAVEMGNLVTAQAAVMMFEHMSSVNATDSVGWTPLHRLDIAQWLHGAGAAINATDINGALTMTPLLPCIVVEAPGAQATTAAAPRSSAGDDATASNSNAGDRARDMRLFDAVAEGDLEAAQAAVADGASVRAQNMDGEEPLHSACYRGHLDIAQWLHSVGAALGATSYRGWTPLHLACAGGHLDIAQWLHSAGATLASTDNEGHTLLHHACYVGHLDIVQWLHAAGAFVDATDNEGGTPLYYACQEGHLDIAQWLHSVGAAPGATGYGGWAPLHLACTGGHLDIAQWLHSAGATLDITDNEGQTPLHLACDEGHLDIAQWLCSAGVDATLKDIDGETPAQLLRRCTPSNQRDKQALKTAIDTLLAAERRGAEERARAAEERARAAEAALLAEEAAPPAAAGKGKSKAKAKAKARAQDRPAPAQSAAGSSSSDVLPPPLPPPSDAADAALRVAMEARDLEALKATINQSASTASDAVLKKARALREQLKERELKAKKQLKREAEAARVREAREAPAWHALQALLDASGRDALRAALARAEALVEDFSELLFDAMVAGNERLQELDQLADANRVAEAEEHALRLEVCLLRSSLRAAAACAISRAVCLVPRTGHLNRPGCRRAGRGE